MVKLIAEDGVVPCDEFFSTPVGHIVQAELSELGHSLVAPNDSDGVVEQTAARVSKRRTQFTANGSTVFVEQIAQFASAAKDRIKAADDFAEAMEIEESFRRMIMGYCELM